MRLHHVIILLLVLSTPAALAGTAEDLARADALYQEDQTREAKQLLLQVLDREPENAAALFQMGRIAMEELDYDEAIEYFKSSTELAPDSESFRWLGHAYVEKLQRSNIFKKRGLAGKVKKAFLEAVAIDPSNIEAREAMAGFYMEAPGIVGGSREKSWEQIEAIMALDEKAGRESRVDYYMKYEEWEKAEVELEALIALAPDDAGSWYRLGRLYQDTEQYERALEMFEKSWALDPELLNALYQIGRTTVIGDFEYATGEAAFHEFFTKDPDLDTTPSISSAHWRLGMLYELQGRYDEAKREYQTALDLDSDNDNAKDALKELKRKTGKLRKR